MCCVRQIGSNARVDDYKVEQKRLILEPEVPTSTCPCLCRCIYSQRVGPTLLSTRFLLKVSSVLDDHLDFALVEGSSECVIKHSIVGKGATPHL